MVALITEGIAKLHFGAKSSDLASKASFATPSTSLRFGNPPLKETVLKCCHDNKIVLLFPAQGSLISCQICLPFNTTQNLDVQGKRWKLAALQTTSIGELTAEFSLQNVKKHLFPLIAVVQDSSGAEYLAIWEVDGHLFLSSMKHLIENCLIDRKNEKWIKVIVPDPLEKEKESFLFYIAIF
jgi:hypothetical protein